MNRKFTSLAGGLAVAALVVGGSVAASALDVADEGALVSWSEGENARPFEIVEGLVFHRGAQINFGTSLPGPNPAPFKDVDAIAPLADIDGLGYTVASSTTYAPSMQLVITASEGDVTYARLVWEPYMQDPKQGPNTGEFTDLEDGKWWGNRVFVNGTGTSPFGSGEGSQSKPQPLSFFMDYFGETAEVKAVSIQQGTSTEGTSVITSMEVGGESLDLGLADTTPFGQADIDAALAKVPAGYVTQSELKAANDKIADLEAKLAATEKALAKADRATDKASDRALKAQARAPYRITGSAKVGKTLRAKGTSYKGVSVKYQWYVGGKKAGKKATLKLKKAHANKRVRVVVTKSYRDSARKKHTVKQTIHLTSKARAKR